VYSTQGAEFAVPANVQVPTQKTVVQARPSLIQTQGATAPVISDHAPVSQLPTVPPVPASSGMSVPPSVPVAPSIPSVPGGYQPPPPPVPGGYQPPPPSRPGPPNIPTAPGVPDAVSVPMAPAVPAPPPIPVAPPVFIPMAPPVPDAPPLLDAAPLVSGTEEMDSAPPPSAGGGDLFEQIRMGAMKNLKKTEVTVERRMSARGGLLQEIRQGNFNLRKVEKEKASGPPPLPTAGGAPGTGLSSIMSILARRQAVAGSDEEDSDDEDRWED
jgi:hypothetical protein